MCFKPNCEAGVDVLLTCTRKALSNETDRRSGPVDCSKMGSTVKRLYSGLGRVDLLLLSVPGMNFGVVSGRRWYSW